MNIADASSARIWGMERRLQAMTGMENAREVRLYGRASERVADMYTTIKPEDTGHYARGRRTLDSYARSFVDIREYTYNNSVRLRSARMTDAQIEGLIQRMNLSHR